jgi:lipopolysaccharide biosynthesis glycosyltransferase
LVPKGFVNTNQGEVILDLFKKSPENSCKFYEIDYQILKDPAISMKGVAHFSDAALYRLIMDQVLPREVDQIVYLDGDLLIRKWDDLTQIYVSKPIFSARVESFSERLGEKNYFNSGVFITSLTYWRQNDSSRSMLEYLRRNPSSICKDQDALNYVFQEINQGLALKSNCPANRLGSTQDAEIIHYVGTGKPWKKHAPLTKATLLWREQYRSSFGYKVNLQKVDKWLVKFVFNSVIALGSGLKMVMKRLLS